MQNIISFVRRNDLLEPIKQVSRERHRSRNREETPFSVYRDILFLAFVVLGRGNIDQGNFKIILIFIDLIKQFINIF